VGMPLWNFSSIGGTIFLTLIRISREVCDIVGESEDIGGGGVLDVDVDISLVCLLVLLVQLVG
jgi:hypothetical protein